MSRIEHLGVFAPLDRALLEAKARRQVWRTVRAQAEGEIRFLDAQIAGYEGGRNGETGP